MIEQVAHLCAAGFALHWLHPKSKKPIGRDWSEQPVHTPKTLAAAYREGNNVGVRTGKWSKVGDLYLHIIDMDIRKDELVDDALAKLRDLLPELNLDTCPCVISGSGGQSRHFYVFTEAAFPIRKFAHSPSFEMVWDEERGRDVKKWDWELHLLGTGAQAVIPPSIHPTTGKRYQWLRPFNEMMLDLGLVSSVPAEAVARITGYEEQVEADPEKLQPMGLSLDDMREYLADLPLDEWCEDRDGWYRAGMAIHHETGGSAEGFDLWCEWSRQSKKFDERESRTVWRSFRNKSDRPIRFASIVAVANEVRFERRMMDIDDDFDEADEAPAEGAAVPRVPGRFADLLGDYDEPVRKPSRSEVAYNREKVLAALTKGDSAAPSWVRKMNQKHAIARVGAKTVVMDFLPNGRVEYGDVTGLHSYYENNKKANSKGTMEPVSKIWMGHTSRRTYEDIVFLPNKEVPNAYNYWQGFSVDTDRTKSCRLFLKHLREVVCNDNPEYFDYLIKWLAHMIQKPEDKPGVAIVIKGKKGTGKDTPFEYVGRLIRNHYVTIANQEQLVGKFNRHLERVLLLHMQEGYWAGSKSAEGALKHLITSEDVLIEPKGMNAFPVKSVLRLFISSNEKWVVPASEDERRYFVLEISNKRRGDHAYFAALRHEMDHGGPSALLHYLLNLDLTGFQVRDVPDTVALAEQKVEGLKNVERWWFNVLQEGEIEGYQKSDTISNNLWLKQGISIEKGEFKDNYARWLRTRRYDGEEVGETEFGKRMKVMVPEILASRPRTKAGRARVIWLPDLNACRDSFERFIGSAVQWPEDQMAVGRDEPDEDDLP